MTVVISPIAREELDEIWRWNAKEKGVRHADHYLELLDKSVSSLTEKVMLGGKTLEIRPDLRYILIRRRQKGYGHVVVYSIDEAVINVLHIFHTAQDWHTRLADGAT